MNENISPLAGQPAPKSILIDVPELLAAYRDERPDTSNAAQRVVFGTSGHRGRPTDRSFNAGHVLAISQAICDYRSRLRIDGPLFLGMDTHAVSGPALENALEVLAANGVTAMIAKSGEYTPTPSVSLAIVMHNRERAEHLADGIVITPSHNPPDNGGFKYNPPHGGPADTEVTSWIEARANAYLERDLVGVHRVSPARAHRADSTHEYDYMDAYISELASVIDFDAIRSSGIRMAVDPLGGAGVHYWGRIAERYKLELDVVSEQVDPTFSFVSVDWDGQIRMDPSSIYAMQRLIGLKDKYDIAFACDTDHDRHGIVTHSAGLMAPNDYLVVLVDTLFEKRGAWSRDAAIGKTVVTTALLDRLADRLGRRLFDVPVGFKWFTSGLLDGSLGVGCEESAGASVLRIDGTTWTTDKDGIALALLSAEVAAHAGRDLGTVYEALTEQLGYPYRKRLQVPASRKQLAALHELRVDDVHLDSLAGERVTAMIDRAPGNMAPIGGIRVTSSKGWFAARPSGTEDLYKIYAESFRDEAHLRDLLEEAQRIVHQALRRA